jgi:hypothetical protein
MATDLELGIRLEVRGLKVEEPGEAILPAARLLAILREAQVEEVTIDANSDACRSGVFVWVASGKTPDSSSSSLPARRSGGHHPAWAIPARSQLEEGPINLVLIGHYTVKPLR